MGVETRRAAAAGRHKKQPPILSHDFIIQNHGDIASAVLMIFILGLMFPLTSDLASVFILPQYNETIPTVTETGTAGEMSVYRSGQRDVYTMFFYTVVMIVFHAVVQEYILDKLQRKVHLSKAKMFKFTESGHQVIFAIVSVIFGGYVIQEIFQHDWDIKKLWIDYPETHRLMTIQIKFYAIIQIAYWLHQFPEFYFQKFKSDEIRQRAIPSIIYIALVGAAYFMHFTRFALILLTLEYIQQVVFHTARLAHFLEKKGVAQTIFRAWNFVFVAVRLASAVLTFVTFWYGLKQSEVVNIDIQAGNFNTSLVRLNAILFLLGLQLYQVYNFMSFHVQRYKERSGKGKKEKKTSSHQQPLKKSKKTDDSESEDTAPKQSPAEAKKKNKKD